MGWVPMYLYRRDVDRLLAWLNEEDEIAFLVTNGDKKWKAVATVDRLAEGHHMLWHIPSGSLPLLAERWGGEDTLIENPWDGWTERRTGADPTVPYFGPGHPGVFRLAIWPSGRPSEQEEDGTPTIWISDFQWIGNYYRIIGNSAHPETERWWRRLKKWVAKAGKRIPRNGPINGESKEIYAFPEALKAITEGMGRSEM